MTALKFWVVFAMLIMTFNEKRYFGCVFFFCPFSLKGVLCYQNFFFFFCLFYDGSSNSVVAFDFKRRKLPVLSEVVISFSYWRNLHV